MKSSKVDLLEDDLIKVSVIIPIYNKSAYLRECLESVSRQTLAEIEVICVDDCSTDSSKLIAREYQDIDARCKLVSNSINQGPGITRNLGLKNALGQFVFFLDADDYLEDVTLETLHALAVSGGDVVLSGFTPFSSDPTLKERCEGYVRYYNANLHLFANAQKPLGLGEMLSKKLIPVSPCKLYRRSFLNDNNIRFIKKRIIHEDEGWFLKWMGCNPVIKATEEMLYCRRVERDSIMGDSFSGTKAALKKSKKHRKVAALDALSFLNRRNKESYEVVVSSIDLFKKVWFRRFVIRLYMLVT